MISDTLGGVQALIDVSERNAMEAGEKLCGLLHTAYAPLGKVAADDNPAKFSAALEEITHMPLWRYSYGTYMEKYHTLQILALVYRDPIEGVSEVTRSLCLEILRHHYRSLSTFIGWRGDRKYMLQYTARAMADYVIECKTVLGLTRGALVYQALQKIRGNDASVADAVVLARTYDTVISAVGIDADSILCAVKYALARKKLEDEKAKVLPSGAGQKRKVFEIPTPLGKERKL